MADTIFVGGLQRQSFLDYPGDVSCVVFLSGCNMRCHYCHNAHLFDTENKMPFSEVLEYIEKNKKMLGAAVISGGEPTLSPHLFDIIRKIRAAAPNLKIKLDTNGTRFDVVAELVQNGLVDFVALDIKAPREKYADITGIPYDDGILQTADFLKTAKCDYMFRTTISPQLNENDIHEMGRTFINGAKIWQIQQFNPNDFSNSFDTVLLPHTPEKVRKFARIAENYAQQVVVRGL